MKPRVLTKPSSIIKSNFLRGVSDDLELSLLQVNLFCHGGLLTTFPLLSSNENPILVRAICRSFLGTRWKRLKDQYKKILCQIYANLIGTSWHLMTQHATSVTIKVLDTHFIRGPLVYIPSPGALRLL